LSIAHIPEAWNHILKENNYIFLNETF